MQRSLSLLIQYIAQLVYGHIYHIGSACIVYTVALHIALCQQAIIHGDGCIEADATRWRIICVLLLYIIGRYSMCDETTESRQYHAIVVAQQKVYMSDQILHSYGKDSARRVKKQIYLIFSEPQPIFCVCEAYTKDSANRTTCQIYLGFCFFPYGQRPSVPR